MAGGRPSRVRGAHALRGRRRAVDSIEESEDPTLAAYNDHLADLAQTPKKKFWGH